MEIPIVETMEKPSPPGDYEKMPFPLGLSYSYMQGWVHALVVTLFLFMSNFGLFYYVIVLFAALVVQAVIRTQARKAGQRVEPLW